MGMYAVSEFVQGWGGFVQAYVKGREESEIEGYECCIRIGGESGLSCCSWEEEDEVKLRNRLLHTTV